MISQELLNKLDEFLTRALENEPSINSDRFCVGTFVSLEPGTYTRIAFTLSPLWLHRLIEAYADARELCTYSWFIEGKEIEFNQFKFYKGKAVRDKIVLQVENCGALAQEISVYIMGWADQVGAA